MLPSSVANAAFAAQYQNLGWTVAVRLRTERILGADPVIFSTTGDYSMAVAVQVLTRLEADLGCEIEGAGWSAPPFYGRLVEAGVTVQHGGVTFTVMCSYADIIITRRAGSKTAFYRLCEAIAEMNLTPDTA